MPYSFTPNIYGTRLGKGQLAKDPIVFQRDGPTNIIGTPPDMGTNSILLLSHAFSETALREQEPILMYYFHLLVSKLKEQMDGPAAGKVDIMSWYNFTTFDIIGDLVLGNSFQALENGRYHIWMRNMFQSIKFLGIMRFAAHYPAIDRVFKLLLSAIPSVADLRKSHFDFTRKNTESRLDRDTDRKDFTTYILRHNDERGMTREEIISTSGVLLIGGSETTATLLSGATYHLLTNPDILVKLQAEVRGAFQDESEMTLNSLAKHDFLPYLEAVLTESLRMYPPIPANLPRMTGPEGDVIDGYFVPANTSVGVHQWAAYQASANFTDPTSFVPERWLPEAPERYRNDSKPALQPFSLGPRNCLGKK
ncbi:MAG: hypothetical protein Q9197_006686 [Variospora fuerteventurae]